MKKGRIITLSILIIIAIAITIFYNTVISPNADKPIIEKPPIHRTVTENQELGSETLEEEPVIEEEHIQYLVNEIGGYNLHEDPINQEPAIMQFEVTDTEQTYTIRIEDNFPHVEEGEANSPDIILHANQDVLIELLSAEDFNSKVIELMDEGKMWMEILANEQTLALKGYKAIYDQVTQNDDRSPTAHVIKSLNWP